MRVDDLTVRFGTAVVLRSVSLVVPARQVVGVIGANGAGKTTLLDVISGETRPTNGTLRFDGNPLRPKPHALRKIGIARTVQGLGLPAVDRTAIEHVLGGTASPPRTGLGGVLSMIGRADDEDGAHIDRVVQLLREFGLVGPADEPLATLPLAAQVRVAIAQAMVTNPRLLLLDEPAAGLGPAERRELATLIRTIATRPGRDCSVVLVAHHLDLIDAACDSVIVLDGGAVIASGTPDEIRGDPLVAAVYGAED